MQKKIQQMGVGELLALREWHEPLTATDILHIYRVLGGLWMYDYAATAAGRAGQHVEIKSKRHSDGYLNSSEVLKHASIRVIIALAMVRLFREKYEKQYGLPYYVSGIPHGATELGEDVADFLGARFVQIVKQQDSSIQMPSGLDQNFLVVEDFCSVGTGLKEVVALIRKTNPHACILPLQLTIINRGGLQTIEVEGIYHVRPLQVKIVALAEHRISDWAPDKCPLCERGSRAIKPKENAQSWHRLITSQQ